MGKSKNCIVFFTDKGRMYRYSAMIIIGIIGLGGFVCFDSIGSLQESFMTYLNLSASDFSLTYSINSWPNVVICFFGGFLIDRLLGIKLGAIVYSVIMCFGHMIFALGTTLGLFWLVLLGRFIFGIGLEVMFISLQCHVIVWFKGKELSMVLCLMISISRLGTSIMYEIANPLYTLIKSRLDGPEAVGIVYFLVGAMGLVSVACAVILKFMDPKKYDEHSDTESPTEVGGNHDDRDSKKIKFKDIVSFPKLYWTLVVIYCAFFSTTFVVIPFTQGLFMSKFDLTVDAANNVTSFFSTLSAVVAPLLGIIVDKAGRTVFFLQFAMANIVLSHAILAVFSATPYIGMFFLAIGFAMSTSALTPMLSFIFPENQLGTAFGVNMAMVNVACSCNMIIAGTLVDAYGFQSFELFIMAWGILGLIGSIILWIQDKRTSGVLNMTPAQRKHFENEKSKSEDEFRIPLK